MDTIPAVIIDEEQRQKRAFAAVLLKYPQDPESRFKAALSVTSDTGLALKMANKWPSDPVVIEEQNRLVDAAKDGELDFLPSKAEAFMLAWQYANGDRFPSDNQVKALDLYIKSRGWQPKVENQTNVQINNNKVMIVRDMGTDAEWEAKAQRQQRALIDVSASKH